MPREGVREVVLAPIGFVCDHVEILYDVDMLFREYAAGARHRAARGPESPERFADVHARAGRSGARVR